MEKLKALLEYYELDKYLGDLMTMGVFSVEDFCKLNDEDAMEIIGSEKHPDYLKLTKLISTVARRHKKDKKYSEPEPVAVEPVEKKEATYMDSVPVRASEESIPNRILLGLAVITLGIVLLLVGYSKEGLFFNDMLLYFIGFIVSSFVGAYLIKEELLSTTRNLVFAGSLALSAFSLYYMLCEGCWRGRLKYFDLKEAGVGPILFFLAMVGVSCFLWKTKLFKSKLERSFDFSSIRKKGSEMDCIRWNTEINGFKFRFAWFTSYISLPISTLFYVIAFFYQLTSSSLDGLTFFLLGGSAILSLLATFGLFRFKYYGYKYLILSYALGIALESLIIFGNIDIYFNSHHSSSKEEVISGIFTCCISVIITILCWVYFIHRKDYFDK